MADYPAAVPSIASNKTNTTPTATDHPAHHNQLAQEVVAIASELGTNPRTGFADVRARLDAVQGSASVALHSSVARVAAISASNTSWSSGTVRVTGAGDITVASDASGVVVSGSQSAQTQSNVQAISASNSVFATGTVRITGGPGITVGTDASGLSIQGAGPERLEPPGVWPIGTVAAITSARFQPLNVLGGMNASRMLVPMSFTNAAASLSLTVYSVSVSSANSVLTASVSQGAGAGASYLSVPCSYSFTDGKYLVCLRQSNGSMVGQASSAGFNFAPAGQTAHWLPGVSAGAGPASFEVTATNYQRSVSGAFAAPWWVIVNS